MKVGFRGQGKGKVVLEEVIDEVHCKIPTTSQRKTNNFIWFV